MRLLGRENFKIELVEVLDATSRDTIQLRIQELEAQGQNKSHDKSVVGELKQQIDDLIARVRFLEQVIHKVEQLDKETMTDTPSETTGSDTPSDAN